MAAATKSPVPDQMRLSLLRTPAQDAASFALGPSNADAAQALDGWPDAVVRVMALTGPSGVGKSHLAALWAERAGAAGLSGAEASVADLPALESRPVLLDDADQADDETLFHLMNLAQAPGGALLMVSREPPGRWPSRVPDLRSRLDAVRAVAITAPDDTVLRAVLRRLFEARSMTPGPDLVDYLILRMERSVPAAREIVRRLDEEAGGGRLNRALVKTVLDTDEQTGELFA